jgi:hypothetical protein
MPARRRSTRFDQDAYVVGHVGESQPRQHVNVKRVQILCDLLTALHVERVIELIDESNGFAQRLAFEDDFIERHVVLDALHAALRHGEFRHDFFEHDLHQPRRTGIGHQAVTAH